MFDAILQQERPNGERLSDKTAKGKERPWEVHKMANELLAQAYERIDLAKSVRLRQCAPWIKFKVQADGAKKLKDARFCRVRLCPMCSWRRSLKAKAQMLKMIDYIAASDKPCMYIMLNLTVRNCDGDELSRTLDGMFKAFKRLTELGAYRKAFKGYYRALEVTHNANEFVTKEMFEDKERHKYFVDHGLKVGDFNPNYNTYHPHFHCILAVNPSYFTGRDYLSQAKLTKMWKQSLRVKYDPMVDVRLVKGSTSAAVAEVTKYTTKSDDYIVPDDWDLTVETVRILDAALHKRKLIGFGGIFRDVRRLLKLDDVEDGDLIHVDGDEDAEVEGERIVTYIWWSGYRQSGYYGREE